METFLLKDKFFLLWLPCSSHPVNGGCWLFLHNHWASFSHWATPDPLSPGHQWSFTVCDHQADRGNLTILLFALFVSGSYIAMLRGSLLALCSSDQMWCKGSNQVDRLQGQVLLWPLLYFFFAPSLQWSITKPQYPFFIALREKGLLDLSHLDLWSCGLSIYPYISVLAIVLYHKQWHSATWSVMQQLPLQWFIFVYRPCNSFHLGSEDVLQEALVNAAAWDI